MYKLIKVKWNAESQKQTNIAAWEGRSACGPIQLSACPVVEEARSHGWESSMHVRKLSYLPVHN